MHFYYLAGFQLERLLWRGRVCWICFQLVTSIYWFQNFYSLQRFWGVFGALNLIWLMILTYLGLFFTYRRFWQSNNTVYPTFLTFPFVNVWQGWLLFRTIILQCDLCRHTRTIAITRLWLSRQRTTLRLQIGDFKWRLPFSRFQLYHQISISWRLASLGSFKNSWSSPRARGCILPSIRTCLHIAKVKFTFRTAIIFTARHWYCFSTGSVRWNKHRTNCDFYLSVRIGTLLKEKLLYDAIFAYSVSWVDKVGEIQLDDTHRLDLLIFLYLHYHVTVSILKLFSCFVPMDRRKHCQLFVLKVCYGLIAPNLSICLRFQPFRTYE